MLFVTRTSNVPVEGSRPRNDPGLTRAQARRRRNARWLRQIEMGDDEYGLCSYATIAFIDNVSEQTVRNGVAAARELRAEVRAHADQL